MTGKTYLVVGAGMMGEAIAYDLLHSPDVAEVRIIDSEGGRAEKLAQKLGDARIKPGARLLFGGRRHDYETYSWYMQGCHAVIGAATYQANEDLTRHAIEEGAHFVDLGGNNTIVDAQFELRDEAKAANVGIIPNCGIAPGAASILVRHAIDEFGRDPDYVNIRVGGLPINPEGPLKYALLFAPQGLINECDEPVEALVDGKRTLIEPMTPLPICRFPHPFDALEVAATSGGTASLTKTYEGRIKELNYGTLRYPGHWAAMRAMRWLGYWSKEPIESEDENRYHGRGTFYPLEHVSPRQVTEKLLAKNLPRTDRDALVLRIKVGTEIKDGSKGGSGGRGYLHEFVQIDMIDTFSKETGHTAMQRTTGYTASIIAQMLANGVITDRGVLELENSVPPAHFIKEWERRGLLLETAHEKITE